MTSDNPAKKAAAQGLYIFRKEYGESDLSLVRDRLLAVLNATEGTYTVKEIIEAGKALSKLHGAYGQEKPLAKGDGEAKADTPGPKLSLEEEARISALLGGK